MIRLSAVGASIALIIQCSHTALGDTSTETPQPPFTCPVNALEQWTVQEKWVWGRACEGSEANLVEQYGGTLVPADVENWPEERTLSPSFLRTVLLREPFRSTVSSKGLRILGARFKQRIDFDGAQIKSEVWIDDSVLEQGANLINANLKRITFDGTTSKGPMIFQGCEVEHDLSLQSGSSLATVDLRRAKIGGSLFLQQTTISGKLEMNSSRIDGDLFMRGDVKFSEVDLTQAIVGRTLELSDAKISGTFDMNGAQLDSLLIREKVESGALLLSSITARRQIEIVNVRSTGTLDLSNARTDGNLLFRGKSEFANIVLVGARVGNQFEILDLKSSGSLDLINARVEGDLYIRDSEFAAISLLGARIGHQVEILGVKSSGILDLNNARVEGDLYVRDKSTFSAIVLRAAKIGRQLDLSDVTVSGEVDMASLEIGTNLFLRSGAFNKVTLKGAAIGKDVEAQGSTFLGHLELDGLDVRGDLQLSDATFEAISLRGTRVGGELSMARSTVSGPIGAEAISIGTTLALNDNAKFHDVSIIAVKVGGLVDLDSAYFLGDVSIENLQASNSALLRDASFDGDLSIILSKVDGSMTLANAHIGSLNLSGSSIGGELSLERMQWRRNSQIKLRNTSVGTVADDKSTWPSDLRVSLGGFVYQRWGGLNEKARSPEDKFDRHPAGWYAKALERSSVYSKQPYEQLASVLKVSGYADDAEDTLFAEKKRELLESQMSIPEKAQKFLSMIFIGFGHRVYYAIPWTVIFIVLGAIIVVHTKEGRTANLRYGLAYSMDVLIPLIKLREAHYKIDFVGGWRPARYYFYLHKIMGFILASFLIAGLSGLTK